MQNLQGTLNWCLPHLNFSPLTISGLEPALSDANMVLQTILGPPFCWRWNRGSVNFNCVATIQDYVQASPNFGFIEKAWVLNAGATEIKEIEVKNSLAKTKDTGRPSYIAAQSDDLANNITYRLMAAPDEAYNVTVDFQKKPQLMTSLASTWSPIPDEYGYIYNWGFLALASLSINDPRFPIFNQKFMSHLLSAAEGLDEMQRNIFLGNWLDITKAAERAHLKATQGVGARQL